MWGWECEAERPTRLSLDPRLSTPEFPSIVVVELNLPFKLFRVERCRSLSNDPVIVIKPACNRSCIAGRRTDFDSLSAKRIVIGYDIDPRIAERVPQNC